MLLRDAILRTTMHIDLSGYYDQDLACLVQTYNAMAGRDDLPELWLRWGRELAEAIALELADRVIAAAWDRDPAAMAWFGRLAPPGQGSDVSPA